MLALRWEDIDFDAGLIHIRRNAPLVDNRPVVGTPKTKKGCRSIPMGKQLTDMLRPLQAQEGYVIGGTAPITKSSYTKAMQRIGKKIDLHGATAHILRHTYATMLYNAGVPPKMIQYIMGHADFSTTMNRYTHTNMDGVMQAGELFCARLAA